MSRVTVLIVLVLTWTAPCPSAASVFSHESAGEPDLTATLAETAVRVIQPGPIPGIFGTPVTEDHGFIGFLKRLRGFFASDSPTSPPPLAGTGGSGQEAQGGEAVHRDWDNPLPVALTSGADRSQIVDIFLGVNLPFFLNQLFSVVLNINEDIFAKGRDHVGWRNIFFGASANAESVPATVLYGGDRSPDGQVMLDGRGPAQAPGLRNYAPLDENDDRTGNKRNLLVEIRRKFLHVVSHPLFLLGAMLVVLFSILRKLHGQTTAD